MNINLLGGLEFSVLDEAPVTRKVKALAAFLALQQGQPQSREKIASLFWDNSLEEQARTNLRQSLSSLRKQLKDALITRDDLVQLDPTQFELDVARFENLITSGVDRQIEEALSIYKGDLLDGFSIKEEGFETWLRPERERLRNLMIDGLSRLISSKEAISDHAAIATLAARLLVLDPINEAAHRNLMKAYAAQGRHEAALKQFETCKQMLKRELGVNPQEATLAEAKQIALLRQRQTSQRSERPSDHPSNIPEQDAQKLALAVLPFIALSGDAEQDYLADGITEDLVAELGRFPELVVIASNSSFALKGENISPTAAAERLKVQYLVQGSVRRTSNRVRVVTQLIDVTDNSQIWADRYDREVADLFELQDDIVGAIVSVLPGRINFAATQRSVRKGTNNLTAMDHLMWGKHLSRRRGRRHDEAVSAFKKAIDLDPFCSTAYTGLALIEVRKIWELSLPGDDPVGRAFEYARQALSLNENDYLAHGVMGLIYFERGEHDVARQHLERAQTLNPNSTQITTFWAMFLAYNGNPDETIRLYYEAARLNPLSLDELDTESLAEAYFMLGKYKKSRSVLQNMLDRPFAYQQIAMCYAQEGNLPACEEHIRLYRQNMPDSYDEYKLYESHMRLCQRREDKELWTEAYRKVGLAV